MNSNLSLYIPYVFVNITEQRIIHVFESLRLGKVRYVDFVSKNARGNIYNSVYVHFDTWYENKASIHFRERVLNKQKDAIIMYDDPWYWIVLENTGNKVATGKPKLRINLSAFTSPTPPSTPVQTKLVSPPNTPIKSVLNKSIVDENDVNDSVRKLDAEFNAYHNLYDSLPMSIPLSHLKTTNQELYTMLKYSQKECLSYKDLVHNCKKIQREVEVENECLRNQVSLLQEEMCKI